MDYNVSYRKKDKGIQAIISYKNENGKWKQKTKQGFKAQKDAKPWIRETVKELEEQIELNKKTDPAFREMTFVVLTEMFLDHKRLYNEPATINNYKVAINHFEYLYDMKLTDITKADCQHCVDLIVKSGLAVSTIKGYAKRVKACFNYAIKKLEIIKDNPLDNLTLPEDNSEDEKIKALSKARLDNLIDTIENPNYKAITLIAGTCGLRIGEIIGLTWDDVDFKNAKLRVNKQWKADENYNYDEGTVKHKRSNRVVPIPPKTLKYIKRFKNLYPMHTSKRIFYTRTNTAGVGKNLSDVYRRLDYDITVHDLRHTYATHLIANGLDFKTVAQLLGHDVQETIKTYSHVNDDMIQRATSVIDKIF